MRARAARLAAAGAGGLLICFGAWAGGPAVLPGTFHEDGRGTPKLDFPGAAALPATSADGYLRDGSARYKLPPDLSNLECVGVRRSLTGLHTRYRQLLNGVPVEGAEITVSQRRTDGAVYQVYNTTYPVTSSVPATKNMIGRDAALQQAWNNLHVYGSLICVPSAELLYVPGKTGFRLVYRTLIFVDGPAGYWEHRIDASDGTVVGVRRHEVDEKHGAYDVPDFAAYTGPTTSLQAELSRLAAAAVPRPLEAPAAKTTADGTAFVFDPDPRTTLADDALVNKSPAASFDPAYFTRPLREITLDAGVYHLQGPWVCVSNVASELPKTAVSTTTDGNWTAKRGDNAFNDAMCYFHIDQNQRYLQSLGYTNALGIQAAPITVDSDGLSNADNSHYVPSLNLLAFGHGGVDDDEDADVILHEYGHALTFDIQPAWDGGDTGAIGEGFGDYWGASYSWTCTNGATYHPAWAFSWDGHSADTWSGRFLDMTALTYDPAHTYVDHETINGIANYSDQLWGTPVYQAFRDLIAQGRPRPEMDRIIIESFFGVGYGVTMREMAGATVMAAMQLYPEGSHAWAYYVRFTNQLILAAYPLPAPTLVYPAGGEVWPTGATVTVEWNRNGAPAAAAARIEYSGRVSGGGDTFFDTVEEGANGWSLGKSGGSDWAVTAAASHSPGHSWFAADDSVTADQYLSRGGLAVTNGAVLAFWHAYDLEGGYDGAVVEISTNGTAWADLGTHATQNGYNASISSAYGNPVGGRRAFSGSSGGFVETRIPLAGYEGKTVYLRFREADDVTDASVGWWVDDIRIFVEAAWSAVATAPAGASVFDWTLPAVPGTNYGVRVRLTGSGFADSPWAASGAFTLVDPWSVATAHGTPWGWLDQFGLAPGGDYEAADAADTDGDGMTAWQEFVAGTVPTNPVSVFLATVALEGGQMRLHWTPDLTSAVPARAYAVFGVSNLAESFPAQPLTNNIPAGNPLPLETLAPNRFFKVGVDLQP